MVTWQLPVPAHAPLQPANSEPVPGAAVTVTTVPLSYRTLHAAPQPTPPEPVLTLPVPAPAVASDSANCLTFQVAVTFRAWLMVTWQLPVPVHDPPQPANTDPVPGVAVSVTTVPVSNGTLQVAPQLSPSGLEVTLPEPVPAFATVSANCTTSQVTVTLRAWLIVT
jgi:hypothetical protein